MGEVDGDGMEMRCEPIDPEGGVGSSDPELEEAEDTDMDLPRPWRDAMGIGTDWVVFSGTLLSLEDMIEDILLRRRRAKRI